MPKKLKDIKEFPSSPQINLKKEEPDSELRKSAHKLKKSKNTFCKSSSPITEVNDILGTRKTNFKYIKGRKYSPPPFLGNMIRVAVTGLLILLLINTINIYYKGKALEAEVSKTAKQGYELLIDGGKSAGKIQFDEALATFDRALQNFSQAETDMWFIDTGNNFYTQNNEIQKAANALLEGGKSFATAGGYFVEAIEEFNNLPFYFVSKNKENAPKEPFEEILGQPSITDALHTGLEKTNIAISHITTASENLNEINEELLPADLKGRIKLAKDTVNRVVDTLQSISNHFPALLKLLGDKHPHRYLILLQNNNEIRPTGGFIGSYAIIDVNEGYIDKLEVHDVYDIDGRYGGFIEPPAELKTFTGNWRLRDSNYSSDFPISAKKARWFLQKEGGPSVDTVIAINQSLLTDLLEITGPVRVGNFGKLNSKNYELLLSYVIEGKIWGADDPKHILKVFIPEFKKQVLKEENISKLTSLLYRAIQQKHILMYSPDDEIQNLFDQIGATGRVHQTTQNEDYLSVINISTGGTKSDKFIEEDITHNTRITSKGTIIDTLTISRQHLWTDDIYYAWSRELKSCGLNEMPDQLIDILGRGVNRVSTRIYVPEGSILLESTRENLETKYDSDLKKTYFFTTTTINAGETDEFTIQYQLPHPLRLSQADTYRLIIEKQPGSYGSIFTKTIQADEGITNLAFYPDETQILGENTLMYATNLVYDRYFSAVFGVD